MLDNNVKVFYWKAFERILFSPASSNDIKKWFKQYHRFVLKLWNKPEDFHKGKDFEFTLSESIKITFSTPFDLPKFSVDIDYYGSIQSLHYDDKYFSELDLTSIFDSGISGEELRRVRNIQLSRDDIKLILESMIVHPPIHIHYEDISHFVRLGFNTRNPFLFLYHLAFQLCDYKTDFRNSDRKKSEIDRLTGIIERNLANNQRVASGELFGL